MKIQLYIVQAPGGAKGDFLAGWLGTLPQFLDTHWSIDMETGQSFTSAKFFKQFSQDTSPTKSLTHWLAKHDYHLHADADFCICGTTHDFDVHQYVDDDVRHLVKTISIRVGLESAIETRWNFFVKTMLTKHRYQHAFDNGISYGVDHYLRDLSIPCNDRERSRYLDQFLQRDYQLSDWPSYKYDWCWDYHTLFAPGGSRCVAEAMQLVCDEKYHELWDQNLMYSHSPSSIERFGCTYRLEEFKNRLKNQRPLPA